MLSEIRNIVWSAMTKTLLCRKKKKGEPSLSNTRRKKNAGSDKMSGVLSEGSPLECYMGLYLALHS